MGAAPFHAASSNNNNNPNPVYEIAHGATVGIWGAGLADMVPTAMRAHGHAVGYFMPRA